jgi:hypothetical protein
MALCPACRTPASGTLVASGEELQQWLQAPKFEDALSSLFPFVDYNGPVSTLWLVSLVLPVPVKEGFHLGNVGLLQVRSIRSGHNSQRWEIVYGFYSPWWPTWVSVLMFAS